MEKKRNDNFSSDEIEVLIAEVIAREDIITKPISSSLTNQMKNNAWARVAEKVTAVSGRVRGMEDVRRKYTVEKSRVKKRAAARKRDANKTGGGPAPVPLGEWEEKLITFIGEEAISGIVGGFETPVCGKTPASAVPVRNISSSQDALDTLAQLASGRIYVASEPESRPSTSFSDDTHSPEQVETPKRRRSNTKGKDDHGFDYTWERWLSLEGERLAIEKERLLIERERLTLERRRFDLEERRCRIDEDETRNKTSSESLLTAIPD